MKSNSMRRRIPAPVLPSSEEIREAYDECVKRGRFRNALRSTIFILVVVAAIAVLISILVMPVLRIYGQSMNDTLSSGDLVLSIRGSSFETGDVIAFYYNNNILVKRVIANSGDWVDIDEAGHVYVNNTQIDEPYLDSISFGNTNISLPYQVPEGKVFVMGDNRDVSIDSRNTSIGCVSSEQIVGKIFFRIWPFSKISPI